MTTKMNFHNAASEQIIKALGQRLNEIRLSQNISQADLARDAGVSRSTLTRLADGRPVSLDSFIRVMKALNLTDQLAALLPDPTIRPVDRVRLKGTERQRASTKASDDLKENSAPWVWADENSTE